MNLDLTKPLPILQKETNINIKYYKDIKDTLWYHTIYRFILDHLHLCTEIDVDKEISDSKASNTVIIQTSVVDILTSLNPNVNVPSKETTKHILAALRKPLKEDSAALSEPQDDFIDIPNLIDHVPTEAFNNHFMEQLAENNLQATIVSGSGLNCMINAIIQHAKQDYHTPNFQEACIIRKFVKQNHPHLDLSGTLHCDDKIASEILAYVNDICSSEIGVVSAFIASSDGPTLYGGTSDKRFTSGKHVAIWQQGNHFVSIIHHEEFVRSSCRLEYGEYTDFEKEIPKISNTQLKMLKELNIITKTNGFGKYHICKPIEEIESILKTGKLSAEDRNEMIKFLAFKLEVDFKTLNNSPRVLALNQSHVLYEDLHQYAVIKEFYMIIIDSAQEIALGILKNPLPLTVKKNQELTLGIPYYLNKCILNNHLKGKKIQN